MIQRLHMDYETFSKAKLSNKDGGKDKFGNKTPAVGSFRYAQDESTQILCCAFALNDEYPWVWNCLPESPSVLPKYRDALMDPEVLIYCHSAQFEMAVSLALMEKTWGIPCPELSRFRCTASLARRASLPAGLDQLGDVLDLPTKKDRQGKALINKFSKMQPPKKATKKNPDGVPMRRIFPQDEPEAFAAFCQYCATDVVAEQGVLKKLSYFDEPINNATYALDAVINARGVPVNLTALHHAQKLIEEETELVSARFREITRFSPTQDKVFRKWLKGEGVELDNLQAETIENFLEEYE